MEIKHGEAARRIVNEACGYVSTQPKKLLGVKMVTLAREPRTEGEK
jgi:hypothetical protein